MTGTGMLTVTALTISGAVVVGVVLALLGSLKLALARRQETSPGQMGRLLLLFNALLVPAALLAGYALDRLGIRPVMIGGSVLLAIALLSLSVQVTYWRGVIAVLLAGAGAAALATATIVLIPRAFFGTHEWAASLNVGLVFFALGALIAPPLLDILQRGGQRRSLALMAFLCLAPAFLGALPTARDLHLPPPQADLLRLVFEPEVWMAALVFFLYAPVEGMITIWTSTSLKELSEEDRAGKLLIGFWTAFLLSRLLLGLLEHTGLLGDRWAGWLIVVPLLLAAVLLGNISGAARRGSALVGFIFLGALLGPVIPELLSLVFRMPIVQECAAPGTTYGLLFAAGSLGSLVLRPVTNLAGRPIFLRIPMTMTLVLFLFGLAFCLSVMGVPR